MNATALTLSVFMSKEPIVSWLSIAALLSLVLMIDRERKLQHGVLHTVVCRKNTAEDTFYPFIEHMLVAKCSVRSQRSSRGRPNTFPRKRELPSLQA